MEPMLQWGLECIAAIQLHASPPLTLVMRIITGLGSSAVYMVLFPLVYWCYDEKKGLRLGLLLLVSAWINISLKFLLNQPRPFFEGYNPSLGMVAESLGGFPSGHAQSSLVFWFAFVSMTKKKWLYVPAAAGCLLIGFSRLYLGVHFPTDVLGGWIIGGAILCGYFFFSNRITALVEAGGFRAGMTACAMFAFGMILYRPGNEALMPGAMLLGLGTGYCLNRQFIGFASAGVCGRTGAAKYITLLARFMLGTAALALIFTALGKIVSLAAGSNHYQLLYFVRFAAGALWVSAGAPRLFCFLRLAESDTERSA